MLLMKLINIKVGRNFGNSHVLVHHQKSTVQKNYQPQVEYIQFSLFLFTKIVSFALR